MGYSKGCICAYLSDAKQKATDLTLLLNAVQFFGGRGLEARGVGCIKITMASTVGIQT